VVNAEQRDKLMELQREDRKASRRSFFFRGGAELTEPDAAKRETTFAEDILVLERESKRVQMAMKGTAKRAACSSADSAKSSNGGAANPSTHKHGKVESFARKRPA